MYQVDGGHWFAYPWMSYVFAMQACGMYGKQSNAHSHLVYVEIWNQFFVPGFVGDGDTGKAGVSCHIQVRMRERAAMAGVSQVG